MKNERSPRGLRDEPEPEFALPNRSTTPDCQRSTRPHFTTNSSTGSIPCGSDSSLIFTATFVPSRRPCAVRALAVDQIVCLGDLVGYGCEPDLVVAAIRDRGVLCVRGNHCGGGERRQRRRGVTRSRRRRGQVDLVSMEERRQLVVGIVMAVVQIHGSS